ncbi:serine/threonine protein kinase [Streptomyces sp. NA04227]|uniref:serine/threonine-protein kinase n=1 Tax=Streptomyces sp. NA04227 TaxID=2742136 RepID=UPI001590C353|nr:serine/threonine-protein kinase [Streptomyces sp. NA04227]QKW08392.1 serine/threonine protein kinase [Streptomyces sp. NA04227]
MPQAQLPEVLRPLGPEDPREISGYLLSAKIGEGGMGAVYFSRTRGGQPVALKLIRREFAQNPDFRARFEAEVQAARRVSGYHIVPVVDHDMSGEQPWIASAYVAGLPLDEALTAHGPLPMPAALQLIGCVAHALGSVHAASVIHRDLKPSNILLSSRGPWVIDFGIARATDTAQLTQTGGFIGTPQFMSPEHALGQKVTPATDIFALGLIAAMVATGRHPYGDGSGLSIAATIANTEHRPPDLSGYPDPLRPLLESCLAADPAQRPAPGALADWCAQAAGRDLREFDGWLPAPVTQEIARREQAAQQPVAPGDGAPAASAPFTLSKPSAAQPPQATYVPTQAAPPQAHPAPVPTPQQSGPHAYAPTQAAYPPQSPHPPRAWPPAAAARRAPAGRPKGPVIAAVVGAVVLLGGGGFLLAQTGDEGGGKAGGDASPSASAGQYTVVVKGQTVTFGMDPKRKILGSFVDLDEHLPVTDSDTSIPELQAPPKGEKLRFYYREFGKSEGPTAHQCEQGITEHALARTLEATNLIDGGALLKKGDLLCGMTSGEHLAMLKITNVQQYVDKDNGNTLVPGYTAELTLWKPK